MVAPSAVAGQAMSAVIRVEPRLGEAAAPSDLDRRAAHVNARMAMRSRGRLSAMADVTRTITYHGDAARCGALVQMLEQEGVTVQWTPPQERRGLGADINEVVVSLVSSGTLLAITAGVRKFRERFPRHKIEVDGEEARPDDGGFLDG